MWTAWTTGAHAAADGRAPPPVPAPPISRRLTSSPKGSIVGRELEWCAGPRRDAGKMVSSSTALLNIFICQEFARNTCNTFNICHLER